MFYDFHIYYDGEYVTTVRALSEDSAIDRVYMQYGSASAYSGKARRLFTARKA